MAKLKSSTRTKRASGSTTKKSSAKKSSAQAPGLQKRAEQMQRSIVDSAQQIWLAGVGAFSRAQEEGTKMFETLVKEGVTIEKSTRKYAGARAEAVRDVVEDRVGHVRGRATDTWDRLEKVFEQRVQRALNRLGVPGRDELADLNRQVESLNAELRRVNAGGKGTAAKKPVAKGPSATKAAKKTPAAKKAKAGKSPAKKAPAKKAPAKKAPARKAPSKSALPKVAKPQAPGAQDSGTSS
ncbi:phasin family protein [Alkalisalibacterium limincola]|uniref:Phasin family protein n=1 Tax=Alkalisalibacterium limincola TaxID=2699169 RepID=A0A5C8KUF1_9GAMM|nr:phasin family protein [Alkalisalibacterium limincola]TXK64551.1 phasin family protein [Alkalisalibacterium limincola]